MSPHLSPGGPPYGGRRRSCASRLRPTLLRRIGWESTASSLSRSAASFCVITSSQNETIASQDVSLPAMALTTAGRERSCPTTATSAARCTAQLGQSASVCCAVSTAQPHSWHSSVGSLPALTNSLAQW
ncbi:jg9274 [Pararge aegeria aegeria]|uniref:Jg9274 protein n=1 Tax=Pararge aegeria aegeria TaxID=348720 RepID=A0A8S4SDU6_9NEOP|nr:jg9274 [Pararge aegeria aegeria]